MRGAAARSQLWAFAYLSVRHVFEFVVLLARSDDAKEIELLALRHEVAMLRRQVKRQSFDPADRARLAVLSPYGVKLHAMCGVVTNVVTAVEMSGWKAHDNPFFRPLLAKTAQQFAISEVSADKAYGSKANMEAVDAVGATPYIPFKTTHIEVKDGTTWPSVRAGGESWQIVGNSFETTGINEVFLQRTRQSRRGGFRTSTCRFLEKEPARTLSN